jgi:hypothetical protein
MNDFPDGNVRLLVIADAMSTLPKMDMQRAAA